MFPAARNHTHFFILPIIFSDRKRKFLRIKLLTEARKWKDRKEKLDQDRVMIGDDYIFDLDATSKNETVKLPGHDDLDIEQTLMLKKYLQNFSNHNMSLQELMEQYYLLPCYLKNKL